MVDWCKAHGRQIGHATVYEHVVRAGRPVRTREIVAGIGASSVSAVTFALTRLVREGNIKRVSYGVYRNHSSESAEREPDIDELEPLISDKRLLRIFEAIRPVLSFSDLSFLYAVVLAAMRLAPDLFRRQSRDK